jgi:hypothetical protein
MVGTRPVSGEALLERSERASKARRLLDRWTDKIDDISDNAGNVAAMARQSVEKHIPGSGPGVAHAGTPDVPVIVERDQPHDGVGAYDVTSNMVILVTVLIKGGELAAHKFAAKMKERRSGQG